MPCLSSFIFLFTLSIVSASPVATLQRRSERPIPKPCNYKFFTQAIDHSGQYNGTAGTFQQRYSIVDDFFEPGGPVLFYQAEQITYPECANDTVLYEWAQELNGLVVSLEHRYFGASKPFGNASSTKENLKYLTLDNVMDDAVEFLDQVKKNYTGGEDSKVIMASGSYGGFLAGAFRMNRPQAIYGSLASAGPVQGFGNSSDPAVYGWWNWTNRVYQDKSIVASRNIKKAFDALTKLIASGKLTSLQKTFNLCAPATPETVPFLPALLTTTFSFAAEFNYHQPAPVSPIILPLSQFLALFEEPSRSDPLQLLAEAGWLYFSAYDFPCLDLSAQVVNDITPYIEQPYFDYITCTYFPLNAQAYIGNGTIFPATNNGDVIPKSCADKYGNPPLTSEQLASRYGFSRTNIENSTRIIWSRGEYDPASGVEPTELALSADRMASVSLFAGDVAHCEDTWRSDDEDPEGLTWLRARELEIIKGWLEPVVPRSD